MFFQRSPQIRDFSTSDFTLTKRGVSFGRWGLPESAGVKSSKDIYESNADFGSDSSGKKSRIARKIIKISKSSNLCFELCGHVRATQTCFWESWVHFLLLQCPVSVCRLSGPSSTPWSLHKLFSFVERTGHLVVQIGVCHGVQVGPNTPSLCETG